MLYHYTSVDGFYSIIENRKFRLTRSEFLNDPSDCKVLTTLIGNYLLQNKETTLLLADSFGVKDIYIKAPLSRYIMFLQKQIPLYVFSLTSNCDTMDMWNYYGNGGAQFELSKDNLRDEFAQLLKTENDFITLAPVKYVSVNDTVETIMLPKLISYIVAAKDKADLFTNNLQEQERLGKKSELYDTVSLRVFVDTYIKGYINSLASLLKDCAIASDSEPEEIFKIIFDNTMELNRGMLWKKDLTLYMLMLSSLIKTDTYQYENEVRVVYFNTSLTLPRIQRVNYVVQAVQGQKYIKPYIETDKLDLISVSSLTLSPLTRNLSIDSTLYTDILRDFMFDKVKREIPVQISKHKVRW